MESSTRTVTTASGPVEVSFTAQGEGHPVLLLHGGAGPASVADFAARLAGSRHAQVLTPTHPGFGGTPRPEALDGIGPLAGLYVDLLAELDLDDVTVVGNSIGGWTAAEIALLHSPRVSSVVLVDAVGLTSATHPIVDFFSLTMDQVTDLSYADPDSHRTDVDQLPDEARAAMAGNRAALLTYGGTTMSDPTLEGRLAGVDVPVLVVWGVADRVVEPAHGAVYADRIPGAALVLLEHAGHLPQIEVPERLVQEVWDFTDAHARNRPEAAGHAGADVSRATPGTP